MIDVELHIDDEVWLYKHPRGTNLPKYFICWERVFEIKRGTAFPVEYHACGVGLTLDWSAPVPGNGVKP